MMLYSKNNHFLPCIPIRYPKGLKRSGCSCLIDVISCLTAKTADWLTSYLNSMNTVGTKAGSLFTRYRNSSKVGKLVVLRSVLRDHVPKFG